MCVPGANIVLICLGIPMMKVKLWNKPLHQKQPCLSNVPSPFLGFYLNKDTILPILYKMAKRGTLAVRRHSVDYGNKRMRYMIRGFMRTKHTRIDMIMPTTKLVQTRKSVYPNPKGSFGLTKHRMHTAAACDPDHRTSRFLIRAKINTRV